MTAPSLNANTAGLIADAASGKIVAALDRNTAALLTVSAQMLAFSLAGHGRTMSEDEIVQEIHTLFNRFLRP